MKKSEALRAVIYEVDKHGSNGPIIAQVIMTTNDIGVPSEIVWKTVGERLREQIDDYYQEDNWEGATET